MDASPIFDDVFEKLNVPWSLMQRKCVWLRAYSYQTECRSSMRLEWRSYWPQIHPISEYRGLIAFDLTSVAYSWPCRDQSSTMEFTWSATTKVCIQTEAPPPPDGLTSKITLWEQGVQKIKERQKWVKGVGKRFVVLSRMPNGPLMVLWAIWPITMLYFDKLFFDADIIPSPLSIPLTFINKCFLGEMHPLMVATNVLAPIHHGTFRHDVSQTSRWGH